MDPMGPGRRIFFGPFTQAAPIAIAQVSHGAQLLAQTSGVDLVASPELGGGSGGHSTT